MINFVLQKLVATSDANEAYTTFTGVTRLKQGITPGGTVLDSQTSPLARAATVSVTSRMCLPSLSQCFTKSISHYYNRPYRARCR